MSQLFQPFDYTRIASSGTPNALQSMQMLMQIKDHQRRNYLDDARRSVLGGLGIAPKMGEAPSPAAIQGAANRMWGVDPDVATKLQGWASTAKQEEVAAVRDRNRRAAGLLAYVENSPPDQRQAAYAMVRQRAIEEMGFAPSEIPEQYDPNFVGMQIAESRDLEQILNPDQGRKTSLVSNVEAAFDPSRPKEERDLIRKNLEVDPDANADLLRTVDLRMRALELQEKLRDVEKESDDQRRASGQLIVDMRTDLNNALELADITDRLQTRMGGVMATGVPLATIRRTIASGAAAVAPLFGLDASEAQQLVDDYDRFTKLSIDFGIKSATRMFDQNMITNLQLQSVRDASVSPYVTADANKKVLADTIERILSTAEVNAVDIKDREKYEKALDRLRGGALDTDSERSNGNVIPFEDLPDG